MNSLLLFFPGLPQRTSVDILTWHIGDTNVGAATERIIRFLTYMGTERVIYFHGWSGFGASAVLRSIADVLPSRRTAPSLCFDRIIHIDCSVWKNRRAMQRAIVKELKLDRSVMTILDEEDENDDFWGIQESSRKEVLGVSRAIYHTLKDSKFVLIFHNGSDGEIDLNGCGVPSFSKFGNNSFIWTFGRRFLTIKDHDHGKQKLVEKLRLTHILLYDRIRYLTGDQYYAVLCKEPVAIAAGMDPTMVADCHMYELFMHCSFDTTTKSDWAGHFPSYLICDGILQEDTAREISKVLHREITWESDASLLEYVLIKFKKHLKIPLLVLKENDAYEEGPYRWISITSTDITVHGMKHIPAEASSFLLASKRSAPPLALPNGLFAHSSKLGVLILRCCSFDFASPPFVECNSLRFLGVDRCINDQTDEREDHTEWPCLNTLWVLDLRFTAWNEILSEEKIDLMANTRELNIEGDMCWQYTTRLQDRLPNLQKLRIIKPTQRPEATTNTCNSFVHKTKLEILDLSGNSEMETLPNSLSKASRLQVLVLDGCTGLDDVVLPDGFPHLLRTFSFDGYGPSSQWTPALELPPKHFRPSTTADKKEINVSKISLEGCTHLENFFIRGLANLLELDLSGSAIKTLDFETMVVEVPRLKRLFLLGCEHLRAIRWGESDIRLELLCVDTRAQVGCPRPSLNQNTSSRLQVYAVVSDARLVRSLRHPVDKYISSGGDNKDVYLDIHVTSSSTHSESVQFEAICKEKKIVMYSGQVQRPVVPVGMYEDILSMVCVAPMQAFPEPPDTTNLDGHIEIAEESRGLHERNFPEILQQHARSLHVHDVFIGAGFGGPGDWNLLKQCRMERCPKLDVVFPYWSYNFDELEIFWVLDLLMVRWICKKIYYHYNVDRPFRNLRHLHLGSCPRLQFVLPVWFSSFPTLETLHIIHCGDLKYVFVLNNSYPEEIVANGVPFPKLTTIHLHDLPALKQICQVNMVAPALETIKIRGCWSLRRLPVVEARGPGVKKPTVEIEKDVWDKLEWGGAEASHYEAPVHCRYYKKKLPRGSVLR